MSSSTDPVYISGGHYKVRVPSIVWFHHTCSFTASGTRCALPMSMQLTFILVPHVFALTTIVFHVVQSQAASSSPSQATSKADSLVHDVVLHGGIMRTCVAELVGECWYTAGVFEALALACEMYVAGQGRRAADSRVLVPVCRFWSLRLPLNACDLCRFSTCRRA